ncbi:gamma-soluble NSF attachment protein-like [Artemia franciscana]|uniref:Gamma-soluble NSF attachment protein n=1 Tax=Artemia franciscana TaxID=6661 RepID=A0AA88IRQ3_ARTSF|nr:hypothetical protein QYM36_000803 [Artemia franciscana]
MENKKLNQALDLVKQAEKYLKTSLLKWRPDYDSAAHAYSEAATCFRNAKAYSQCQEALQKASQCHKQTGALFSAAKCIDQVIAIAKDLNQFDVIPDLAHKACNLYLEYGAPDTAAISLDKAAKAIANDLPEEAMKLYIRAADVVDTEERPRDAAEYIGKAARSMVTLKKYEDATKAILKEMGHHQTAGNTPALGRCTVALVLVVLAQEDVIEAKKMFEQWGSTCDSEEIYSLSQIIQGYEEDDPDLVKQGLSSSFIRSMDVAYAKLARDLSLPNVTQATSSEKPDKVEPPIVQSPIEEDEDNELDRLEAKMNAMRAQEEIGNEEKNYTKEDEEEEELDLK